MGRTKSGIEASGEVKALLLLASDLFAGLWRLASLSYSSIRLAGGLLQGFHQAQNTGAFAMEI